MGSGVRFPPPPPFRGRGWARVKGHFQFVMRGAWHALGSSCFFPLRRIGPGREEGDNDLSCGTRTVRGACS